MTVLIGSAVGGGGFPPIIVFLILGALQFVLPAVLGAFIASVIEWRRRRLGSEEDEKPSSWRLLVTVLVLLSTFIGLPMLFGWFLDTETRAQNQVGETRGSSEQH